MPQLSNDDFFSNEEINIDREDNDSDNDSLETDSSEASDFEQMQRVLHDPGPTAEVHELQKTSESLSIDASISKEAKKYTLLYNFWVPDGLFLPMPKPDVDPHSPTCWTSPEAKLDGAVAELYSIVPSSLHKHMETYKQFGSIFTSALSQEWSNILRAIKDCAGIVFTPYGLDPTCLSGHPSGRKEDPKFQILLKKDGVGEHMRLAPILFKKHDNMVASEFLMSLAITLVSSLTDHKRGQPKARGQHIGINSATSGLISGAATLAHFLVSPDLELSSISGETCIPYSSDYNFYVEKLSKKSNWALCIFDHVNHEVFGKDSQSKNTSLVPPVPPTA
ncbi:hypothetical protein M404DRAFT_139230 [Pisolithus tinctorius Marx 270]|uniref:Uncharacterized protein n=1 Tax=Pisolithus tinctorius Marx 270 TaxID=870435 RepID=A0A0C3K9E7_PISTI|nr:hypothetical protein M404DRAFT_139230 [Pisolithus tinctorius Marx 270]